MTRDHVRSALSDHQAVVATLYGEVRGEPVVSQAAVAGVIANRVRKPSWWGRGWKGVCLHKWQFSCWWEDSKNAGMTYAFAQELLSGKLRGHDVLVALADLVMADGLADQTRGACHYVTTAALASAPPAWAKGRTADVVIGSHAFFRGVP